MSLTATIGSAAVIERPGADEAVEGIPSAALSALVERLGHAFEDETLLHQALTHRSWCAENSGHDSNERLEFLGDSVLGLVVTEYLFERFPSMPEGGLAMSRAGVVSASALAEVAAELGLGDALRLGRGEHRSGGRTKPSILADAMEAVIGAVHIDGGIEASRRVVLDLVAERAEAAAAGPGDHDHKTRLEKFVVQQGHAAPAYELTSDGPDHAPTFRATVSVRGEVIGTGVGPSKRQAEQAAARAAWDHLAGETSVTASRGDGSSRTDRPAERRTDA